MTTTSALAALISAVSVSTTCPEWSAVVTLPPALAATRSATFAR
jgi:hypothetical protein